MQNYSLKNAVFESGAWAMNTKTLTSPNNTNIGNDTTGGIWVDGYEFAGWDTSFDSVTSDLPVTAVYRELPKPAPQPEQPTPVQPAPQPGQKDETVDDLIQTGVDIAPAIAVPVVIATLIAVSIARRKRK